MHPNYQKNTMGINLEILLDTYEFDTIEFVENSTRERSKFTRDSFMRLYFDNDIEVIHLFDYFICGFECMDGYLYIIYDHD